METVTINNDPALQARIHSLEAALEQKENKINKLQIEVNTLENVIKILSGKDSY